MPLCRLQAQLGELERFFRYCSGLRERRPLPQRHYYHSVMGITGKRWGQPASGYPAVGAGRFVLQQLGG